MVKKVCRTLAWSLSGIPSPLRDVPWLAREASACTNSSILGTVPTTQSYHSARNAAARWHVQCWSHEIWLMQIQSMRCCAHILWPGKLSRSLFDTSFTRLPPSLVQTTTFECFRELFRSLSSVSQITSLFNTQMHKRTFETYTTNCKCSLYWLYNLAVLLALLFGHGPRLLNWLGFLSFCFQEALAMCLMNMPANLSKPKYCNFCMTRWPN